MRTDFRLRLPDYRVLFFDLDGTLVDGSDRHFVECVCQTAKDFGKADFRIPPGIPLRQYLRANWAEADEEFLEKFHACNKERMLKTPRPVRFHEDTLSFIRKYSEYPRALVTNCHDWELELTERELNLREIFETVIYKAAGINGKPAPDLYLHAAQLFDAAPRECLVFEDSATGIRAGKNAGMTVVGIDRGTHHDFQEADLVISSFLEL